MTVQPALFLYTLAFQNIYRRMIPNLAERFHLLFHTDEPSSNRIQDFRR